MSELYGFKKNLEKVQVRSKSESAAKSHIVPTLISNTPLAAPATKMEFANRIIPELANWNVVVLLCKCGNAEQNIIYFRGSSAYNYLIDALTSTVTRGTYQLDWANNRIRVRWVDGNASLAQSFVQIKAVYGLVQNVNVVDQDTEDEGGDEDEDIDITGLTEEVLGIRIGADGTIYDTAGEAVREQYNKLAEMFDVLNVEDAVETIQNAVNAAIQQIETAGGLILDPTLTQSGQAANAKVTGDEIGEIKNDLSHAFGTSVDLFDGSLIQGIVNSAGGITTSNSAIVFNKKVPVTGGSTVVAVLTYTNSYPRYAYWAQFDSNGTLISRAETSNKGNNTKTKQYYSYLTTSANCAYVQPYYAASGSNPLSAGDFTQPKLYYGNTPNDLVNIIPLFMRSENIHLLTTTASDICGSDLNNLVSNRTYAVNITDGSLANAPVTQMTGRIVTYGKNDHQRGVGDIQVFYHTSGKVYFRIVWSSVWQAWQLLNDNGIPQVKILACGDSICSGARNDYKGFVGDLGLDYKNIGVGDATLSNVNTSVTNIPDALVAETAYNPDVIVADGGINDYHYEAALGTIPTSPVTTDADAALLDRSTIMGGAGYMFYQMIKKFPNAQRFFIITHKTYWNTGSAKDGYCPTRQNTQGYTQQDLHDALVEICTVYGVKVIDVYNESLINSAFDQYRSDVAWSTDSTIAEQYMVDADGVHPTANGYINGYVPLVKQALGIGTVK